MKRSLFFATTLLLTFSFISFTNPGNDNTTTKLAADQYKVIKVDGEITIKESGTTLQRGDVLSADTKLNFDSPNSRAAVISSIKGRFVLKSGETGGPNLLPAMNNMSSRAGALLNKIDLKNHFKGDYLVLGDMELKIGENAYPLDNGNFFYVQYKYNGEKINKKLGTDKDENKILINPNEIFKIDGKIVDANPHQMTIYYRKKDEKKSLKINDFNPVFPELSKVKSEVDIIIEEFSERPVEKKIDEITAYLNQFYGTPDKDDLAEWLEETYGIKSQ